MGEIEELEESISELEIKLKDIRSEIYRTESEIAEVFSNALNKNPLDKSP